MQNLSQHWFQIQDSLFPHLEKEVGVMGANHERLVTVIELSGVLSFVRKAYSRYTGGRHYEDRASIAAAFLAKHIFNLPTTRALIDRLQHDASLRRLCGWERKNHIPSEATFSRAFQEFTELNLTTRLLDALIIKHHGERLIGHIRRDATEIDARERPARKPKGKNKTPKRAHKKKGHPKKGEVRVKENHEQKRLEKQQTQSLKEMLDDLPRPCDVGSKVNSQGYKISWTGYKLHLDTIDGDIPVSAILTSASLHDSQVALPLSAMTELKIQVCYELMDSAYDAALIRKRITEKGRKPLIDFNRRSQKDERKFENFEQERYKNRSGAERVNSNLKDNLGACTIRVRGNEKVFTHLGFGLLIMAVEQTLRLLV